jgi:hypothetical protein
MRRIKLLIMWSLSFRIIFLKKLNSTPFFFISRLIFAVLAAAVISGCMNYYRAISTRSPGKESISPQIGLRKTFVIHNDSVAFIIEDARLVNDSLSGKYITRYLLPYGRDTYPAENATSRYYKKKGDYRLLNEVHIYARNIKTELFPGYTIKSLAVKDISRLDVYNHDKTSTTISWIFGIGGSILGGFIALSIFALALAALSGSSCPYVYVNTGEGFALAGEIYSGAVYKPLERDDYLALPRLVAGDGKYKLKLSNELEEIQYTNLAELIVADHPENSEILIDKYGNYQTAIRAVSPFDATNFVGRNVLELIKSKDSVAYSGPSETSDIPLTDGIIMTFPHTAGNSRGKLFIRARNSLWLDYVYKNSHELFGSYYDNWVRKQDESDAKRLTDWSLDQKIPLSVYLEKNNQWVFCDYFNMAGPAAFKEDVIAIDLGGLDNGPIRIKLEAGSCFWEIDYAGIDYSVNIPAVLTTVKPDRAITGKDEDVTDMLRYDDLKYYVQSEMNDVASLSFIVPPASDSKRTVILHSKGHYTILGHDKGAPKIRELKRLREKGMFLEYSRELMRTTLINIGWNL